MILCDYEMVFEDPVSLVRGFAQNLHIEVSKLSFSWRNMIAMQCMFTLWAWCIVQASGSFYLIASRMASQVYKRTRLYRMPTCSEIRSLSGYLFCSLCINTTCLEIIGLGEMEVQAISCLTRSWQIHVFMIVSLGLIWTVRIREEERILMPRSSALKGGCRKGIPRKQGRASFTGIFLLANLIGAHAIDTGNLTLSRSHPDDQRTSAAYQSKGCQDCHGLSSPCGVQELPVSTRHETQEGRSGDVFQLRLQQPGHTSALFGENTTDQNAPVTLSDGRANWQSHCCNFDASKPRFGYCKRQELVNTTRGDIPQNVQEDMISLMQVGPPAQDMISHYVGEVTRSRRAVRILSWFHASEHIGRFQHELRHVHFDFQLPGGMAVRAVWGRDVGRRAVYIVPVRPPPATTEGATPTVIVTTTRGDNILPTYIEYWLDAHMTCGSFLFVTRAFLTVSEMFLRVIPMNQCVWQNECTIMTENGGQQHVYDWYEVVPIQEGSRLIFSELTPPATDGSSTCADLDGTDSEISDDLGSGPPSHESPVGEDEMQHGSDEHSLVQLTMPIDLPTETASPHLVIPSSIQGIIYLDNTLAEQADALQLYVRDRIGAPTSFVGVHAWLLRAGTHEAQFFARRVAMSSDRSFSMTLFREGADVFGEETAGVTIVCPALEPLQLRAHPVDLIAIPEQQLREGCRAVLIDIIGTVLPKRVAVILFQADTVRAVAIRIGVRHLCDPQNIRCSIQMRTPHRVDVWEYHQRLSCLHGAGLTLLIEQLDATCTQHRTDARVDVEDTSHMQMGRIRPHPCHVTRYLQGWFQTEGEVTLWIHCRPDVTTQMFPASCSFDRPDTARKQCEMYWDACHGAASLQIIPVDPPPVFLFVARPHMIVVVDMRQDDYPILVQTHRNGQTNLLSILVPGQFPPVDVAALFHLALPQHECASDTFCYAVHEQVRYMYRHDIPVQRGAFYLLFEHTQNLEATPPTSCGESSPSSDVYDEIWTEVYERTAPTEGDDMFSLMQRPYPGPPTDQQTADLTSEATQPSSASADVTHEGQNDWGRTLATQTLTGSLDGCASGNTWLNIAEPMSANEISSLSISSFTDMDAPPQLRPIALHGLWNRTGHMRSSVTGVSTALAGLTQTSQGYFQWQSNSGRTFLPWL